MNQGQTLKAIEAERTVQDALWGGKPRDSQKPPREWMDLLHERAAKLDAVVAAMSETVSVDPDPVLLAAWRRHLIELAALSVAALEVT